jgi:hypothetical protein
MRDLELMVMLLGYSLIKGKQSFSKNKTRKVAALS